MERFEEKQEVFVNHFREWFRQVYQVLVRLEQFQFGQ